MKKLAFTIALFYGISAQAAEQNWWQRFIALFSASQTTPTKEESYHNLYTDKIGIPFKFNNKKYNVVYEKDVGVMNIYEIQDLTRGELISKDYNKNGITYQDLRTEALNQSYTEKKGKNFSFKYQPFLVINEKQNQGDRIEIYELTNPKKLIQHEDSKDFYSKLSKAARDAITNHNKTQSGETQREEEQQRKKAEYENAGYFKKWLLYFKYKLYKQ